MQIHKVTLKYGLGLLVLLFTSDELIMSDLVSMLRDIKCLVQPIVHLVMMLFVLIQQDIVIPLSETSRSIAIRQDTLILHEEHRVSIPTLMEHGT